MRTENIFLNICTQFEGIYFKDKLYKIFTQGTFFKGNNSFPV